MDTRNSRETSAHSVAFHEQQFPLFDAYATGELDEDERVQVEQLLQSCQECQQLFAEVTHLRSTLGTLLETENPFVPGSAGPHSSPMLRAVMARIEQRKEDKGNHFTKYRMKQAQTSFHSPSAYSPASLARKRTQFTYLSLGAALLCLFLLISLFLTIIHRAGNGAVSRPAPMPWIAEQSMLVQNSAGIFALKEIEITTAKEFRFYYVFKSSHQGTIQVTAVSSLSAGQEQPIPLSATVQSLGTIDGFSVGVIRVQYLERVGQTIALRITSSAEGNTSWQLTPLKQLVAEPHPEGGGYYGLNVDQHLFPEITWSGTFSGPSTQSMFAFFKNAAGTRYILLQVDYAGKVVVITREECLQLGGGQICH